MICPCTVSPSFSPIQSIPEALLPGHHCLGCHLLHVVISHRHTSGFISHFSGACSAANDCAALDTMFHVSFCNDTPPDFPLLSVVPLFL